MWVSQDTLELCKIKHVATDDRDSNYAEVSELAPESIATRLSRISVDCDVDWQC